MDLPYAVTHACGVLKDSLARMASTQSSSGSTAFMVTFPTSQLCPKGARVDMARVTATINDGLQALGYNPRFDPVATLPVPPRTEAETVALPPKAAGVHIRDGHVIIAVSNPQELLRDWEHVCLRARIVARASNGQDGPVRK
jgi:hypothetical protein